MPQGPPSFENLPPPAGAGARAQAEADRLEHELYALGWSEEQVRGHLGNAGDGLHALVGVGELDWIMTERDLDRIGAPLTRILNRFEPTRQLAEHSDYAAVAVGAGLYTWRSLLERRAVLLESEREGGGQPAPAPSSWQPPAEQGQPAPGASAADVTFADGYVPLSERIRAAREAAQQPPPEQER